MIRNYFIKFLKEKKKNPKKSAKELKNREVSVQTVTVFAIP